MNFISFGFQAYGVETVIETNHQRFLDQLIEGLSQALPNGIAVVEPGDNPFVYRIIIDKDGSYEFFIDGELDVKSENLDIFSRYFLSRIRLRIAERAVSRVFIHAGAVVWKGAALIFPANSFQGKTTLVAELVKNGAEYLSDEYAVFDEEGQVHAFPKMLSVRRIHGSYVQTETPVERFGDPANKGPYPPGLVLFTEFAAGANWDPVILTPGQGMLEILSHTIPIRYNPKFSLGVLNKVLNHAIIGKSKRADSKQFAKVLLEFVENHFN